MRGAIRGTPAYFAAGIEFGGDVGAHLAPFDRLIVCGMGGSAFPGDLLALSDRLEVPVVVSRDYGVRAPALGPRDLVFACSYSGDTEETLSALTTARSHRAQIVTFSAGGRLAERARAEGLAHVMLKRPAPDFQPRAATGFFLGAFAAVLEDAGVMAGGRAEMLDQAEHLAGLTDLEERAVALADRLVDQIAVIYAPHPWAESAARIAKIKLNENAKVPAFYNAWPELNHNEMVGFTRPLGPLRPVLLVPHPLSPAMTRRVDASIETFRAYGQDPVIVELVGATALQQALAVIALFDFASCRLAELAGTDPNPVAMIEDFKRRLV